MVSKFFFYDNVFHLYSIIALSFIEIFQIFDLIFSMFLRKVSIRVSLHGMLKLILVDTLRFRVHNVGFLAGRLRCVVCAMVKGKRRLSMPLPKVYMPYNIPSFEST